MTLNDTSEYFSLHRSGGPLIGLMYISQHSCKNLVYKDTLSLTMSWSTIAEKNGTAILTKWDRDRTLLRDERENGTNTIMYIHAFLADEDF